MKELREGSFFRGNRCAASGRVSVDTGIKNGRFTLEVDCLSENQRIKIQALLPRTEGKTRRSLRQGIFLCAGRNKAVVKLFGLLYRNF